VLFLRQRKKNQPNHHKAMKKLITFFCAAALMSAIGAGFVACHNDEKPKGADEKAFLEALRFAPVEMASIETLPQWILDVMGALASDGINNISIWRGTWNDLKVCFIYSSFNSCVFCETYYENGDRIVWNVSNNDVGDFMSQSKNWVLIWRTPHAERSAPSDL
jgi:hypothetical protein